MDKKNYNHITVGQRIQIEALLKAGHKASFIAKQLSIHRSSIYRELKRKGYRHIITRGHDDLELRYADEVFGFFINSKPEYVFLAAAHAGGVQESISKPAELLVDNILIATNVITACHKYGVKKLINMASSCVYPVDGKQPYTESQIGEGKTDENWSYAIAKIAAIELCRAYYRQYGCNFMTVVPCNLYGINDKFGENSHVIPALIRKFHESEGSVEVWGDGQARREFLYSDDMAKACVMLMENFNYEDLHDGIVNVGTGKDIIIADLFDIILYGVAWRTVYGLYNKSKPSGVKSKLMDVSLITKLGWQPEVGLKEGIARVYEWYKETHANN